MGVTPKNVRLSKTSVFGPTTSVFGPKTSVFGRTTLAFCPNPERGRDTAERWEGGALPRNEPFEQSIAAGHAWHVRPFWSSIAPHDVTCNASSRCGKQATVSGSGALLLSPSQATTAAAAGNIQVSARRFCLLLFWVLACFSARRICQAVHAKAIYSSIVPHDVTCSASSRCRSILSSGFRIRVFGGGGRGARFRARCGRQATV